MDRKEVEVEYCLTERMVVNFFMKHLLGALFFKFIDVIMGLKTMSSILINYHSSSKEHVETNNRKL